MRIESLRRLGTTEWVMAALEDGGTLRVPLSAALDCGLRPGLDLSEEELERLRAEAGLASAKQRAVRIMAASGVSEKELRERLCRKGEQRTDAEAAVGWLKELNLLDDRAAARRIVESGAAKGYGAARIRQTLREKGIDRAIAEEALGALPEPDEAIDRYLTVKLGGEQPDRKELKKLTDALLRRGFSWESIRAGLRRCARTEEEEPF